MSLDAHTLNTVVPATHGFLGFDALDAWMKRREIPLPPGSTGTAWGGLGSHVLLAHRATGTIQVELGRRFAEQVQEERHFGFYEGLEGTAPVLAAMLKESNQHLPLALAVYRRLSRRLSRLITEIESNEDVNLSLSQGLCGSLLAADLLGATLGRAPVRLRRRAVELIIERAVPREVGHSWPTSTGSTQTFHGLCNGSPAMAFVGSIGWRYTGDQVYRTLTQLALPSVPVVGPTHGFCCGTLGRIEVLIEAYRSFGDTSLLPLARSLFSRIDPAELPDESWKAGRAGYRFTARRLDEPLTLDLPGFPLRIPISS